jgi:hypothetical protein
MTRLLNFFLLGMLLIVGLPYYWLLLETRPGDAMPKAVSMGQLRALAAARPGPLPTDVEMETVAHRTMPNLICAGSGMKRKLVGRLAFRLPVSGGGPILIEPATSIGREAGAWLDMPYAENRARIAQARHSAGLVVAMEADPADDRPAALAPGIVAIPASSRSPGARLLYVRLADGAEYLFTGDVAPMALSWAELRNRPRLVTDYWFPEDRRQVFEWLRTIRKLKSEAPALHIVPGYDVEWLAAAGNHSGVTMKFRDDRASSGQ